MNFTLTRQKDDGMETLGILQSDVPEMIFQCDALERPWKENKTDISCIPAGVYTCKWMPFYDTFHYELQDVPGRTGVFIHNANKFFQVEGCIAVGSSEADINEDGQLDVLNSVQTLDHFEQLCDKQDITLTVIGVVV